MRLTLKTAILKKFGPGRQYVAAREAGISENALSRIVVGRREPTETERREIARALEVPDRELFLSEETG